MKTRSRTSSAAAIACWLLIASTSWAEEFTDDAQRHVELPTQVSRVFAAGAPAEILLYTLVPEMLGGLNHQPTTEAREFIAPEYRSLAEISTLPDRDDPRYDRDLLALKPDVYIDYGTIDDDYVGALEAISERTGVRGIILNGRLEHIPTVYRRLGAALGVAVRGEEAAAEAERILRKYRNALAGSPVRAYLACSQDGLTPCVEGHASGEAAQWLGAANVAGTTETAPRRPFTLDEIRAAAPTVIIAANASSAAQLRADPQWRVIGAVAAGRVYAPPALPFNWGPRPPSVNRLLGMVWMAYALPGRELDAAFFADVGAFFETFYHVVPSQEQLRRLVGTE